MSAVAGISFELKYDGSKMMSSIDSSCNKIKEKFTKSFAEAGKSAKSAVETSNKQIQAILDDTTRSAKSKAAAIAAIYKKEGDSMSDAMKKAWSHIERESASGSSSIKKDMKGMSKQSQKTAEDIKNNLSGSFSAVAKKAAVAFAAAFSVKKIVNFGAECIELGSDLLEVQNVVDVTFPLMTKQVNEFAQNAAASFGLSETMAKKFTGTFGAMAKAFGFSESVAYDMSTTLTGLAGDVASFYNITQDEAYTKLKSVFTGETESLKDLGVVMTQTALDSYALANGFGKTTAKMTEAEKVALRYQFVQEQLAAANEDFGRTSNGWANQVRILKLQFDSLKATLGQGLINVFTPVIKVINTLVGKLMTLANAFKSFTEMFGTGNAAAELQATASAADNAAASTEAIGDAAASSAKKMKGLFAFDQMNVVSSDSDSSDGTSGGYGAESFDMGSIDTSAIDEVDTKYQSLLKKTKEFVNFLKQGLGINDFVSQFTAGIKKIDFESIQTNFKCNIDQLSGLAKTSVDNTKAIMQPMMGWIGNTLGNTVAIVAKKTDVALGGTAQYLEKNAEEINAWSQSISQTIGDAFTDLTYAGEDISNAIMEALEEARPTIEAGISDLLTGFTDLGQSVGSIVADAFGIASSEISQWVSDNESLLQSTISEFYTFSGETASLIGGIIGDIGNSLSAWWEESGSPLFQSIIQAWNDIKEVVLRLWNEVVMPVLWRLQEELKKLWDDHLKGLWENILSFISSVGSFIMMLWNQFIKPCVDYLIDTLGPIVKSVAKIIISVVGTIFGVVSDIIGGILRALGGVLDFLTGVFTLDWEKTWEGIRDFFGGIWDGIVGILKGAVNLIIDALNLVIAAVYNALRSVINGIGGIAGQIGSFFGQNWNFSIPNDPPQIPKLAQGAYVKANTPQLVMIGDNRHQGEIVAPEDKLYQLSAQAMQDVMQQFMSALIALMGNNQGNGQTIVLKVTGDMAPFVRLLKIELEKEKNRTGIDFKVVYE